MIKFKFQLKIDLEGDEQVGFTLFKNDDEDIYVNPDQNLILSSKPNEFVLAELFLNPRQITRKDLFVMFKPGMDILIQLTENDLVKGMIKGFQDKTDLSPALIYISNAYKLVLGEESNTVSYVADTAYYLDDTVIEVSSIDVEKNWNNYFKNKRRHDD